MPPHLCYDFFTCKFSYDKLILIMESYTDGAAGPFGILRIEGRVRSKGCTKLDKAEYKIKLEEINSLAEHGDFDGAAKAADDVDWRHVRSSRTLCMIGEIYEACKRYDDSLKILKYAYKRSSASKTVLYRLAELSIRKGDFDEAKRFMNEFEQLAPNDSSIFILKYKLLRANKATLDEQIAVLQQYKDREYTERWAYELAKLYKRNGQTEKCVEECDDMILWFSEGRFVQKAMELKMQFTSLTATQQIKYESMKAANAGDKTAAAAGTTSVPAFDKAAATVSAAYQGQTAKAESLTAAPAKAAVEVAADPADGMTRVEQAVAAASESEEAVESLDLTKDKLPEQKVMSGQDHKFSLSGEMLQNRLADSIKAVFSGMRPTDQSADEVVPDIKPQVRNLEPESDDAGTGEVVREEDEEAPKTVRESEDELAFDQMMKDDQKEEQLDLDRLFAETSSNLAGEVASGNYILADTLEEDRPADAKERQIPIAASDLKQEDEELTGRETDESLGLTREFHFREELAKAMAAADHTKEDAKKNPIPRPEEAAKKTVLKAKGRLGEDLQREGAEFPGADEDLPDLDIPMEVQPEGLTSDGISDEDLLQKFGDDEAIRRELLADEEPEEGKSEEDRQKTLMNLSAVSGIEGNLEGSKDIIEHIMEEPEVFQKIPVEARKLEDNEKKALSYFAKIPGVDFQVTTALADIHNNCGDKTSKSGNVIIMGRQGSGKTRLAQGLILAVCQHLNMQAAKTAIVVADEFNQKDPAEAVSKLAGGFLVIEAAGSLSDETIDKLNRAMEFRTDDLLVILEDEKADMRAMLDAHPDFAGKFSSQITVPVFMNDELVTFAKTYAKEMGYKLDELATLALYTMIGDNQKESEPVTVSVVKQMVDKGIDRHNRKLRLGKSEKSADGRTILKEKDFNF